MIVDCPPLPYSAPDGHYYEYEEFKHNVVRIWLCNTHQFDYNLGAHTKTVWGFYNSKRNKYYAPINAKTVGKEVDIKSTRNYTAMQLKQSPLDAFFV
jgi:hypothetical protein